MNQANRYKLGLFAAAAIILIILSFFLVGVSEYFEPKLRVLTVFKDSVEGLKVGSPVKYKGVALGRVTRMAMRNTDQFIDVYMIVYSSAMDTICQDSNRIEECTLVSLHDYFMQLKKQGIRCSLQSSGITGGVFIELDSNAGKDEYTLPVEAPSDVLYIPSRPSHITAVIENISKSAEQLAKVDFVELSERMSNAFESIDTRLNDPKITDLVYKMNSIAIKLEALLKGVDREDIEDITGEAKKSLVTINRFLNETNNARQVFVTEFNDLKRRIVLSLTRLDILLDRMSELTEEIDNDPASILRGKRKPYTIPSTSE